MFRFSLQILSKKLPVLRIVQRDIIINVHTSSYEEPVILVTLLRTLNFLVIFSEITQVSNLIKIRPVGAELFHAYRKTDGRTDMTKQIIAFRNFSKAPTNRPISRHRQKRKECCVWTNYTHSSYKTRCCYISNIFNGAGERVEIIEDNPPLSTGYQTETSMHTAPIHLRDRSEAFKAKHATSYTGCRNLGDCYNPLQPQRTAARSLVLSKRGT